MGNRVPNAKEAEPHRNDTESDDRIVLDTGVAVPCLCIAFQASLLPIYADMLAVCA